MQLPRQSGQTPRILIVDDDPALRLLTGEAIGELGLIVDEAGNGFEALQKFRRQPADLVLLDVRMPRMDGFTACERLLELPGGHQTTIVMVTGLDDHDSIRHAYELGVTDFITKPINWTILPERVLFLLRARETFQALKKSEARLIEAQRIASMGYWEWDIVDNSLLWSDQIYRIFGLDPETFEANLDNFLQIVHPEDRKATQTAIDDALKNRTPYSFDHRILRPGSEERCVHEQAEIQYNSVGRPVRMVGTTLDITERKKAEKHIHRLAYYDSLTGLPNRHLFREIAEHAMAAMGRHGHSLALLHIDIDRFSRINDTLGHDTGDLLLRSIAQRLSQCVRSSDMVAHTSSGNVETYPLSRLGADEFLVLLTDLDRPDGTAIVAQRLLHDLSRPIQANRGEYILTASIGIALFPDDCGDLDTLLRYADTSLHYVKSSGGNAFRLYSTDMNNQSHRRLGLETHLHRALEREEFELHYQYQTNIGDGRLVGLEALLRWRRPDEGLISPADFIPLAEETGLIVPIGEWVVHAVCRHIAAWRQAGYDPVQVAVNLSARQFAEAGLMQTITRALADNQLDPWMLELELTESLIMQDAEAARRKLWAFHEAGLGIAVDDFGTGYSSMNYLKRFPLDTLKIDRSFVRDISTDVTDAAIIKAIIALGQALDLTTLAEGVETEGQLDALARAGCDQVQGFLIGRPLAADQIYPWVERARASLESRP